MRAPLVVLGFVAGCGNGPTRVAPVARTVELWDADGGSSYCADIPQIWEEFSTVDVSNTNQPNREATGGVCAVPVNMDEERFVLESVTCVNRRTHQERPLEGWIDLPSSTLRIELTPQSPVFSASFGRGIVYDHNVRMTKLGTDGYLECTFQGYYVYPTKARDGHTPATFDPWGPRFEILERRPSED